MLLLWLSFKNRRGKTVNENKSKTFILAGGIVSIVGSIISISLASYFIYISTTLLESEISFGQHFLMFLYCIELLLAIAALVLSSLTFVPKFSNNKKLLITAGVFNIPFGFIAGGVLLILGATSMYNESAKKVETTNKVEENTSVENKAEEVTVVDNKTEEEANNQVDESANTTTEIEENDANTQVDESASATSKVEDDNNTTYQMANNTSEPMKVEEDNKVEQTTKKTSKAKKKSTTDKELDTTKTEENDSNNQVDKSTTKSTKRRTKKEDKTNQ
ncbi:putative membrane domain protein [Mycoplasma feriruminatoris]|nr:putative membrane domain protein [Mycoplasma feriruminatoris]VZK65058.1 hypothetical protein MF5292_00219 [Mycoplasma feriruminatoris]VZR75202.1 hypothetical protein MF5294_00218 [Mycoplasma feriruminatoris]VZR97225.1 hypothetical protein MF5293_00216 [Mycoplasma feriruminatoris]